MDWFKKHADTITILSMFAICFWHINEKMNEGFRQVDQRFVQVDREIAMMDQDIAIIKTVLIMKQVMPIELSACTEESK